MKESQNSIVLTNVTFVLHPKNQHTLLHILTTYSLQLVDLSKLLNISEKKLTDVLRRQDFLHDADAKKLAKYFCIFCGS